LANKKRHLMKVTGTLATDRNESDGITEHPVTDIQIINASGGANTTAGVTFLPMPSMSSTDKSDR